MRDLSEIATAPGIILRPHRQRAQPLSTPSPDSDRAELSRADLLLRQSLSLLAPWIRLLVAQGVTYPRVAQELKILFLEAARAELSERAARVTDSALSLLSGVHRKDVRALRRQQTPAPVNPKLSRASEVATRWLTDPAYLDGAGRPAALPQRSRDAQAPSFERLSTSVSKDFHPRAVLDELVRLGIAVEEGESVRLVVDSFTPQAQFANALAFFAANVRDHLAAGAANLAAAARGEQAPFLEHAMFADELSPEGAQAVRTVASRAAKSAVDKVISAGSEAVQHSRRLGRRGMRVRFGVYFYAEPEAAPPDQRAQDSTGP